MTEVPQDGLAVGHPSPARHRGDPLLLAMALGAPPAAWLTQLLLGFVPPSYFCWFGVPAPPPGWPGTLATIANLAAFVVAIAAFLVAKKIVRETRHDHSGGSQDLLDVGEGRTRFLAVWAAFSAVVFAVAIVANTLSLKLEPLCRP
jgi:hypothetical protein